MTDRIHADLLIVGAGPTGLFAAYNAGFRGLRVAVVDSLPELGGQITAMYPEKAILDVGGFASVKGRELVDGLVAQAASADPVYLLGRGARTFTERPDGVEIGLDDGTVVSAAALVITAGIGTFTPRPLPAGEGWLGHGLEYFVPTLSSYAGKDVVVVGGGDSAVDWAIHLEPVAASVALVHRRPAFRAHERSVAQLRASAVDVITPAEVTRLSGAGSLESVEITVDDQRPVTRPCQALVAALGFVADLGAMKEWGIEFDKRHIVVDSAMRTNLPRVFAAGDVTEYPGKVRLIAVGFGEAATAVNNAAVVLDPSAHVFPGHSTDH